VELNFSAEEAMLRDTISRYVEKEYSFEARKRRLALPDGFDRDTWRALAELGAIGAALPADDGGFGAGAMGTLIVAQALGRGLVVEPYLATAVLGAGCLELAASGAQRALLTRVASGELLLALAHAEPGSRYDATVATRAVMSGSGFVITGSKAVVLNGATADTLIVSARTSLADGDSDGVSLFLLNRTNPDVRVRGYRTVDGLQAADIEFTGVLVEHEALLGELGDATPVLAHVTDRANAALTAEATGAMQALLERTVTYLGTRQQFGLPLARFQALQHRVADMAMHVEQARSMAYLAALNVDRPDATLRARTVSAAKARVCSAANFVGKQAVQLHGGIGMTDALDVSHYFRRLTAIERTLGDEDYHIERFVEVSG
jgi:alkylation response protein AidB-like acyl-CoA dehydrogenase